MHIDHIGIAVKDIEEAIRYWETVFDYRQATEVVLNTRQKVYVAFMEKDDSLTVKLIQPSEASSTVTRFLKKGGTLHHLCFKTEDLDSGVVELKERGLRSIVPPQPGEAFGDHPIAFFFGKGLNIEVIDTDCRAKRIDASSPE